MKIEKKQRQLASTKNAMDVKNNYIYVEMFDNRITVQ